MELAPLISLLVGVATAALGAFTFYLGSLTKVVSYISPKERVY